MSIFSNWAEKGQPIGPASYITKDQLKKERKIKEGKKQAEWDAWTADERAAKKAQEEEDAAREAAREKARERRKKTANRGGTVLTGGQGVGRNVLLGQG